MQCVVHGAGGMVYNQKSFATKYTARWKWWTMNMSVVTIPAKQFKVFMGNPSHHPNVKFIREIDSLLIFNGKLMCWHLPRFFALRGGGINSKKFPNHRPHTKKHTLTYFLVDKQQHKQQNPKMHINFHLNNFLRTKTITRTKI